MDNNFDFLDFITILSLLIAIQNLAENREQTAANDVHKANSEQAEFLLKEISTKFDELKEILLNGHNEND